MCFSEMNYFLCQMYLNIRLEFKFLDALLGLLVVYLLV